MAPTLHEILLAPDAEPAVVADCLTLIAQEVAGKSGISGAAVKLAYKTAKAFAKGYLRDTVEKLLPDFVGALEPYWADFTASGASGFGDYLAKRGDEVAEALLSAADDPETVRRFGEKVLVEANRLGDMVSELIELSRLQGAERLPDKSRWLPLSTRSPSSASS